MANRIQVIKRFIYLLGLLGANLLVTFAAMLAFILFLLRDDPILAAVPALFALPAIVLQPWFLVFFFVPVGMIIKSVLTTVLTIFVYGWLDANGTLERPKQILSRFKTLRMLAVAGGFVLLAIAVVVARGMDFPALNHGLPPTVQGAGLNVTDSRSYCLAEFIDSQWVWRASMPESELSRLMERFNLRPVDRSEVPDKFRRMPPYWWHPSITERTTVLMTPGFPLNERGPDGWFALATWNPDDQVIHMWIKNNF